MKHFATLAFAALFGLSATALADDDVSFFGSKTPLTDEEEVQEPPVVSDGLAIAFIAFDPNFRLAVIRVTFNNLIGKATRLHFHCNVAGQNGPIALGFVDLVDPASDNSEVVTLGANTINGRVTNAQFPATDPCPGVIGRAVNDLASLAEAINAGQIYWNLHTTAFPAGELRGQVQPLEGVTIEFFND